MMKMVPEGKKWFQYVVEQYPQEIRIGFDPTLMAASKKYSYCRNWGGKNQGFWR